MLQSLQKEGFDTMNLIIESLDIQYFSIKHYNLDYTWHIRERKIEASVFWYIEQGKMSGRVRGKAFTGTTGDLICIPAASFVSSRAISDELRVISINFHAAIRYVRSRSWAEFITIPLPYALPEQSHVPSYMKAMLTIADTAPPAQQLLLQGHLLLLFGELMNHLLSTDLPVHLQHGTLDPRIQAISEYLANHPAQMKSVEQMCTLVDVSEPHLRRLFYRHTGLSPIRYMQDSKLDQGKKLLQHTDDRISDIALSLGFEDSNYFARLFKKKTGFTPKQFRDKHRGL